MDYNFTFLYFRAEKSIKSRINMTKGQINKILIDYLLIIISILSHGTEICIISKNEYLLTKSF